MPPRPQTTQVAKTMIQRRQQLRTLLLARGYTVADDQALLVLHNTEYGAIYATDQNTPVTCIIVPEGPSLNKKDATLYVDSMQPNGYTIILCPALGSQTRQFLVDRRVAFEHLHDGDICCNKPAHVLVPVYRKLGPAEIQAVVAKYGSQNSYPRLVEGEDAMARYLNFRAGDVLEVKKKDLSTHVAYRLVVSKNHE